MRNRFGPQSTHYIPFEAQPYMHLRRAACGEFVDPKFHHNEPSCINCINALKRDEQHLQALTAMTPGPAPTAPSLFDPLAGYTERVTERPMDDLQPPFNPADWPIENPTPAAEAPAKEVLLIDLSSIAYPIWHMNQGDPNPNSTSQKIVAKVRDLAKDHKHVAICKDSGRSFRKDLTETYKANRPESDATLQHQITLACRNLEADGFPIWQAKGFEADDVLASAAQKAIEHGFDVMVVSDDKDLLQLVGGPVRQFRPTRAVIYDTAKVKEDLKVEPNQIVDYLSLVGDKADNIYGAKGIGEKTAATLLEKFGSMVGIYKALEEHPSQFKPACATSLKDFQPRVPLVQQLVELRYDAPIEGFAQVLEPRKPAKVAAAIANFNPHALDDDEEENAVSDPQHPQHPPADAPADTLGPPNWSERAPAPAEPKPPANVVDFAPAPSHTAQTALTPGATMPPSQAPAIRKPAQVDIVAPYERQLDPRNLKELMVMSENVFNSMLFSAYGSPQAVATVVMFGRELGIPMMTSLRMIHNIDGKLGMSAQLMVALVMRSGFAEYFEPLELSDERCTWETKRKGSRNPFKVTHTIQMAEQAGLLRRDRDGNLKESNWAKNPQDMLTARASSRLARMIYPDIVGNLYTPEELQDIREQNVLAAKAVGAGA